MLLKMAFFSTANIPLCVYIYIKYIYIFPFSKPFCIRKGKMKGPGSDH